ncbi:hypothetical protein HK104_007963 [Borealophlyctis nickersoniae]|nr:hypothetical protein HK104_007963 [Borealophlyctis nickersoniae]
MSNSTPTLKLYGSPTGGNVQRTLFVLYERNIPFTWHYLDFYKKEHKTPAHFARHPFGRVPVLEDGNTGFQLFESRAINRYLCTKYPDDSETSLYPTDLEKRAIVEQWMSVEQSDLDPHGMGIVFERVLKKAMKREPNEDQVAKLQKVVEQTLDVYEKTLASDGRKFLAGDALTLADVHHAPAFAFLEMAGMGHLFQSRKHVAEWWGRIKERPAWRKAWGQMKAKM